MLLVLVLLFVLAPDSLRKQLFIRADLLSYQCYCCYYAKLKLLLLSYGFILQAIMLLLQNLEELPVELPQISFSSSSQMSSLTGSGMTGSTSFSGIFFAACFVCVLAGLGGDYCGCSSSSSSSYIVLRWNGLTSFLTGGFAEAVDFV